MVFNFNLENKKGIKEIISGKGDTDEFFVSMLIMCIGFLAMPWVMEWKLVLFRCFILLLMTFDTLGFYKTIIKVSLDENNLRIKIWRAETLFRIQDINQIKITYFITGFIKVKLTSTTKHYYLYAPNYEGERHKLFLDMIDYLDRKLPGKVKIKGIGRIK